MDKEIFKTYKILSFALNPHNFEWQCYGLESISIKVDKFAVSNPQLSDLGSKPQFSSAPSFVENLLLSTFFAFSGKPQKIMEGLPVRW